jgi:transposase
MPSCRTREVLAHQAVMLHQDGLSRRAIARALGIGRNTVGKLLREHDRARRKQHSALEPPPRRTPRTKKIDAYRGEVEELLERYDGITAQRVLEELKKSRANGRVPYDGGDTALKELVRELRPKPKPAPSLETPKYGPGKMAESDWSPYTIDFTAAGRQTVQAFGYALPHCKRKSFYFFERSDLHALMDGHVQTFERFGGCAEQCKYDSQKAVVTRWEGSQPIYNVRFLAFCTYYRFRPLAVRRGHPNDKPVVERSFWELVRSFFSGRSFRDMVDLRAQLSWWLDNVCDTRVHKKTKRTPLEMFGSEEREHLVALAAHPYDTARVAYCVCSIDGYVCWAANRYAVPYEHVTDILPVRITQHEIFIYAADLRCVAQHELAPRGAGEDVGSHGRRKRQAASDLDQLCAAFEGMGEGGAEFFASLSMAQGRGSGYHARQILVLRERYTTADVLEALGHARAYGAYTHQAVERILTARAAPRRLDEHVTEQTRSLLEQRIGQSTTEPRDLRQYDRLPEQHDTSASEQLEQEDGWLDAHHPSIQTPSSND